MFFTGNVARPARKIGYAIYKKLPGTKPQYRGVENVYASEASETLPLWLILQSTASFSSFANPLRRGFAGQEATADKQVSGLYTFIPTTFW
ncbi:MAG: hypothetical protein DRP64_20125 [Verrucomicrobia bacterium]|nr:MAG: hypothetical protein DRP64_20125 [Verrucomicrobiota bacterium]